jgi:hypothetical protein
VPSIQTKTRKKRKMKRVFSFLLLLAAVLSSPGTLLPESIEPLAPALAIADLISGNIVEGRPYNASTFEIGTDRAKFVTDATLLVKALRPSYKRHIIYNYDTTVSQTDFTDEINTAAYVYPRLDLPRYEMDFSVIERDQLTDLISSDKEEIEVSHRFWTWFPSDGYCANHGQYDVCVVCYGYREKKSNGLHNLLLIFVLGNDGNKVGKAYLSTGLGQNPWFEHTFFHEANITWTPKSQARNRGAAESEYNYRWANTVEYRDIDELGADVAKWRKQKRSDPIVEIDPNDNPWNDPDTRARYVNGFNYSFYMKLYGVGFKKRFYMGEIDTHIGPLPKRAVRNQIISSFSLAKGVTGVFFGAIDKKFGATFRGNKSIFDLDVYDIFPEAGISWSGTTVKQLFLMNSRHIDAYTYFYSQDPRTDEVSRKTNLEYFNVTDYNERRDYQFHGNWTFTPLTILPAQEGFVYKSINYETIMDILDSALKESHPTWTPITLFQDLLCDPLKLSYLMCKTVSMTTGQVQIPWGAYGMFGYPDDYIKIYRVLISNSPHPIMKRPYYESLLPLTSATIGTDTNVFGARNPDQSNIFDAERFSNGIWSSKKLKNCDDAHCPQLVQYSDALTYKNSTGYDYYSYLSKFGGGRAGICVADKNKVDGIEQESWFMISDQTNFDFKDWRAACFCARLINPCTAYVKSA